MHDPSAQLQQDLQESVGRALAFQRPILTHINADTTWLLQLPYPKHVKTLSGRSRFNILIDPWLQGPQSDVASWFSSQWHAIASSVQTIAELNHLLQEVEHLASAPKLRKGRSGSNPTTNGDTSVGSVSFIDVVVISHEFTDHCHKETLLEIDCNVPMFATKASIEKAADLIRSWNYFSNVWDTPVFGPAKDWKTTSINPLPSWIGISRLVNEAEALYYHSAILITFDLGAGSSPSLAAHGSFAEAIIYTPHGIKSDNLRFMPTAKPPIKVLALLHGLHDVSISITKQLNLGAHNALKAQQILDSKYWVGTHDEVKIGGGIVAPFLRRKVMTVQEALEKEQKEKGTDAEQGQLAVFKEVSFANLASGESLLLE